jgi:hypothetical protein
MKQRLVWIAAESMIVGAGVARASDPRDVGTCQVLPDRRVQDAGRGDA